MIQASFWAVMALGVYTDLNRRRVYVVSFLPHLLLGVATAETLVPFAVFTAAGVAAHRAALFGAGDVLALSTAAAVFPRAIVPGLAAALFFSRVYGFVNDPDDVPFMVPLAAGLALGTAI